MALTETKFRFGHFELDRSRRLLTYGGEPVTLNSKTFDLLIELVESRGSVVSKDELLDRVWPGQFVEENNLTVQISALRKVFGDAKGANQFIATVPGRGYSFVAEVESVGDEDEIVIVNRTIERIVVDENPEQAGQSSLRQLKGKPADRRMIFAVAGLVVMAIAGIGAFSYFGKAQQTKISSIAVLPFVNQTSDENNEYLTDGLAESVIYSLSQQPGLRVMSLGAVFRYKGKDADAKLVGRDLNVQAILTGRVAQRGDTVVIRAELISASDNTVIWGEQFTRRSSDLEKLQSDIAGSISDKLRFKLSGVKPRMTENAEAYRAYLQGLYYWNKRTPDDIRKSIELFQTAIRLDPKFGQAYGGLAMAMEVLGANGVFTKEEGIKLRADVKNAVARAFEVDPDLAEAHAVQGNIRIQEWDFAGSEASFKRAIEINPNFATAHQWYSELLSYLGRHSEALAEIEKALELDPYSRAIQMNLGLRHLAAGRTDDAINQFRKLGEMEPEYPMSYMFLSEALAEKGLLLETLEPDCKADNLLKVDPPGQCEKDNEGLREAFKSGGAAGFWNKSLEISQRFAKRGIFDDTDLAGAYFRAGEKDKGFELLERAFANRDYGIVSIKVDSPFRHLAGDPRYDDLLKRIGLPE